MTDWLDTARALRRSQYSPVLLVDSNDPRRVEEAQLAACNGGFDSGVKHAIFDYSEWRGLVQLEVDEKGALLTEAVKMSNDPMAALTGGPGLKDLDAKARAGATLVLHDFTKVPPDLVSAINAWSVDGDLLAAKATIILFVDPEGIPQPVRERCHVLRPPLSTRDERRDIILTLASAAKKLGTLKTLPDDALVERLVNATGGMDLNQVEGKLAETINAKKPFDLIALKEAKAKLFTSFGLRVVEGWPFGFESVGGYAVLKDFVAKEVVAPLRLRERAERYGIKPAKGLILFGPPGTGKTYFAKALSNEVGIPMVMLDASDLFGKYVGESEQRTRTILKRVEEMAPAILFVDEIDQMSGTREGGFEGDSGTSRRVENLMLSWLADQSDVFVVGTTNLVQRMDVAFLRSGRFDLIAPMDFPDETAREAIFRVQCEVVRKLPLAKGVDYGELAETTEYATGADIEEVVTKAAKVAMLDDRAVAMKDFREVLGAYRIPAAKRQGQREAMLAAVDDVLRDKRWAQMMSKGVDAASRVEARLVKGGA